MQTPSDDLNLATEIDALRASARMEGLFGHSKRHLGVEVLLLTMAAMLTVLNLPSLWSFIPLVIINFRLMWVLHEVGHAGEAIGGRLSDFITILSLGLPVKGFASSLNKIHHRTPHAKNSKSSGSASRASQCGDHPSMTNSWRWFLVYLPVLVFAYSISSVWRLLKSRDSCVISLFVFRWTAWILFLVATHQILEYFTALWSAFYLMGFITSLNHIHRPMNEPRSPSYWRHHFFSTQNLRPKSAVATWTLGGLNYHIEHHIAPEIPSYKLHLISGRVQALASKYGLPYEENSLTEAFSKIVHQVETRKVQSAPNA